MSSLTLEQGMVSHEEVAKRESDANVVSPVLTPAELLLLCESMQKDGISKDGEFNIQSDGIYLVQAAFALSFKDDQKYGLSWKSSGANTTVVMFKPADRVDPSFGDCLQNSKAMKEAKQLYANEKAKITHPLRMHV